MAKIVSGLLCVAILLGSVVSMDTYAVPTSSHPSTDSEETIQTAEVTKPIEKPTPWRETDHHIIPVRHDEKKGDKTDANVPSDKCNDICAMIIILQLLRR